MKSVHKILNQSVRIRAKTYRELIRFSGELDGGLSYNGAIGF